MALYDGNQEVEGLLSYHDIGGAQQVEKYLFFPGQYVFDMGKRKPRKQRNEEIQLFQMHFETLGVEFGHFVGFRLMGFWVPKKAEI